MTRIPVGRTIEAGLIATLAVTLVMYVAPMMGIPKMDIAAMLGSLISPSGMMPGSGAWWMGMLLHFINGTVIFSLIYAYFLYPVLPGPPWVKGLSWGTILWFLSQAVVMPMMGMGFFSMKAPEAALIVTGSLIGHFIYGSILGALTRPPAAQSLADQQHRPAA